ncbi:heparin lyase I family protein [Dokdonella sp.]|uniref:heparin lyase I family protein n=1 Tax=Dokdonella sp. TaxID=2291710 RepID=UPI001AFD8367|nr:heparin lyase I family protein [Dokdonella sp.]MBO9661486.1 heparin lyase I family protein [Dokdonella sp.]
MNRRLVRFGRLLRLGRPYLIALFVASHAATAAAQSSDYIHADGFDGGLPCVQFAAGQGWSHQSLPAQQGDFAIQFDATPSADHIDSVIGLSDGAADAFDDLAAAVSFRPEGHISARNGSAYPGTSIAYSGGGRYRFRVVVHLRPRVYSIYVTPPGGSERTLGSNFAFRTQQATASRLDQLSSIVAGPTGSTSVCGLRLEAAPPAALEYGYLPPVQIVGGGTNPEPVPAGYIHQTAWDLRDGGPDIEGVYAHDFGNWKSLVWRWADTRRVDSIQRVHPGPGTEAPVYRFELTQADRPSSGTDGNHPRAEFFSVDPEEDRRGRVPPRENIIRDGDEYWATYALYLRGDFPLNHQWATLGQRKFQNGRRNPGQWFTLNVHRNNLDYNVPLGGQSDYHFIANVSDVLERWIQVTIHEKASSGSDGLFELYIDGARVERREGATLDPGDINYNFHIGYYRENDGGPSTRPGTGVVYMTPLLILRGANPAGMDAVPSLP